MSTMNLFGQRLQATSYALKPLLSLPSSSSSLGDAVVEQQDCLMMDYSTVNELAVDYQNQNNKIELWQFLLELLEDPKRNKNTIRWLTPPSLSVTAPQQPLHQVQTSRSLSGSSTSSSSSSSGFHDNDFVILDTHEVAKRWALRRSKPIYYASNAAVAHKMFNRILRSYYTKKNILHKVAGKSNTFSFQINIQPYLNQLRAQSQYEHMVEMKHSWCW